MTYSPIAQSIEQPIDTGTHAKQENERPVAGTAAPLSTPAYSNILPDTLRGLVEGSPRNFGGPVGATLLLGFAEHVAASEKECRDQNVFLRSVNDTMRNELEKAKIDVSVLTERLSNLRLTQTLRDLALSVGAGFCAFGLNVTLTDGPIMKYGVAFTMAGAALWLGAFFAFRKGNGV